MAIITPHAQKTKEAKKNKGKKIILPLSFFQREDVTTVARDLLGKWLVTQIDGELKTGGLILETEAYAGIKDRACHAFGSRRTKRTEVMYHKGGISYIYFCYGMHHLLNFVTNKEETPHAVLIRALFPTDGVDLMLKRRGKLKQDSTLTKGPGTVCQALGLTLKHNALPLCGPQIWVEDRGLCIDEKDIFATPRIGVDYAGEDAKLPYRFYIKEPLNNSFGESTRGFSPLAARRTVRESLDSYRSH